ncbi:MAG: DMT family transporter [Rhodobacteraceae bacterium]|nr:DMT family transporter [Paracoccaceae bacterium]
MEPWILFSILAAAAQTIRFALQKSVAKKTLSVAATTWARFFWSWPVAALIVIFYANMRELQMPSLSWQFFIFAIAGGVFQILATACTISLFSLRAFAVGITFKKTEVMLTALVGFVILGDRISTLGFVAILIGLAGVLLLSQTPSSKSIFNRAAGIGLLSGVLFALAAVTYRGATQAISSGDTVLTAGVTLAIVSFWQTLGLGIWIAVKEPDQIGATLRSWRTTSFVSLFSLIGSWSWFAAFTLMNAAYVFAVGQVELIFSALIGMIWFKERLTKRELAGMSILLVSIMSLTLFVS